MEEIGGKCKVRNRDIWLEIKTYGSTVYYMVEIFWKVVM